MRTPPRFEPRKKYLLTGKLLNLFGELIVERTFIAGPGLTSVEHPGIGIEAKVDNNVVPFLYIPGDGPPVKTAILPVKVSGRTEWRALVGTERPEAKFEDVVTVPMKGKKGRVQVDPIFCQVIERETLIATAAHADTCPICPAARIQWKGRKAFVRVECAKLPGYDLPPTVLVRIEATAKGQSGRFREFTAAQAARNAAFWASAHHVPGK